MFEYLMTEFQHLDNGTKQGLIFAVGIAGYYLVRRLSDMNKGPAEKRVNKKRRK